MARIVGIIAGLNPTNTQERDEEIAEKKSTKKAKLQAAPDPSKMKFKSHPVGEIFCDCCSGQIGFATVKRKLDPTCSYCSQFFGRGMLGGSTHMRPELARKVIDDAREAGWVMILRSFHGAAKNGDRCEVDAGDIFKVRRAGSEVSDEAEPCTKERTWNMFTLTVMIGPHELTQFPHEISAITLAKVLDLQKQKQLEMVYVSKDDENGHFTPVPEMRKQIYQAFGPMVNV